MPPMRTTPPQPRLIARLVAAIYGIAATLRPVIDAIARHPGGNHGPSWDHRARLAARFSTVLQNLLALTAQIGPATLAPRPAPKPRLTPGKPTTPRQPSIRPAPPRAPHLSASHLSARQLARRLAALLAQLVALAAEAGAILPAALRRHAARARRLAGCPTLPPHLTWKRAG